MGDGTIYILVNEAMEGYTKIGKTTSPVEQRMKELDSTGVPLPFECFYAARVEDIDFVERKLHDAFHPSMITASESGAGFSGLILSASSPLSNSQGSKTSHPRTM